MEEEAGRVFQYGCGFEAVYAGKFAGLDSFLDQSLEDAQNFFPTARRGVRPDLNDVPIRFEDLGVLLQFLFSFAMQFENDGLNSRRGGDWPLRDFFDELFDFSQPFVDDRIENVRFGFEKVKYGLNCSIVATPIPRIFSRSSTDLNATSPGCSRV